MSSEAMPPCELPPRFPASTEPPDVQAGFQRTSIGEMPMDWVVDRLSTNWEVIDCKHITANFISSGMPVVSIGEVQGRFVDIQRAKHTTPSFYSRLIEGGRKPRPGDLIFSRNATVGEVAQVAHWHPPFAMGQDVCLLRKRFPDYSSDFLQSVFQSDVISRQLEHLMVGSTFRRVNVRQVKGLVIPFPGPVEQRAIAESLSDMDQLLGGLESLIAKKRAIKQGAMQQLLTGKTRLPGFSGEWKTRRIGDQLVYERPDQYIVRSAEYTERGDIAVLTANKSFILGYTDETFGICRAIPAIVFDDFTTDRKFATFPFKLKSSAIKLLRPRNDRVNLRYMFERMQLIRFPISDHKRHYIAVYQHIELSLPKYEEQTSIVSVLSDMDAEIEALEDRRDKTRAIKQGMMQQLLTGRIRLVKPQPAEAEA